MANIGQRSLLPPRVLVYTGSVGLLALFASILYLFEINRQEHRVWAATADWFSAQGKNAPVGNYTFMPSEKETLRDGEIVDCFAPGGPERGVLRAFRKKNLRQRPIVLGRGKIEHIEDAAGDGTVWDWLADKLMKKRTSDVESSKKIVFSRVGFDDESEEALVYAEYHCPLCGYGGFFLLEKRRGTWTVMGACTVWES